MKPRLILLFLLLGLSSANAQFTYFNNRYNNDYASGAKAIIETDYGYVISGVSGVVSNDYLFKRIVLTSIDDQGNQLWWKTYGEEFHNYYAGDPRSTDRTHDGGFIIGGCIEDSISDVGLLIKFDQKGDSLWSRTFGDLESPVILRRCQELTDHGIILIGSTYISGNDVDIRIIKTDSLGNVIWQQTYGKVNFWEEAYSVAQLPDGGFIIGFAKEDMEWLNSADPGILKIDNEGNQLWMKYYGSSFDEWGCNVAVSKDGNYLFGTTYAYEEPGPGDPLQKVRIIKIDTAGNIIWDKKYGYPYFLGCSCTIDELPDGNIIVSGQGGFQDSYNMQGWIIKVEPDGDSIWMRRYDYYHANNGYLNYLLDIDITSDNGIILTGEVLGEPEWEQSIWVQKLDSIGCDSVRCDTTVEIAEERGSWEAGERGRMIVYPNPAGEQVHVRLNMDDGRFYRDLRLEIYDIFGREVYADIISSPWTRRGRDGIWNVNVSSFPPGVYIAILKNGSDIMESKKFIIAR